MLILNPSAVWTFSPPAFIVFPLRSLKNLPSAFFLKNFESLVCEPSLVSEILRSEFLGIHIYVLLRVKDERLQLREWEILIEQTLRRSDWREWHSRKEREWDYLLSLTPPCSLSLCSHLPLGECTHSCARSLLVHTRSGLHGAHTHTVCRRWLDCLCWLCTSKKKSLSAGGTVRSFWTGFRGVFMFTRVWGK